MMQPITDEQWAELDAVAATINAAMIQHLDPAKVDAGPMDDRSFYILCTSFMFLYKRMKDNEKVH